MPNIPVVWRAEQTVNTVMAVEQFDPDIVRLANADILVSAMMEGDAVAASADRRRTPVDPRAKAGRSSS